MNSASNFMNTIIPPFLKPGDTIGLAATARKIDAKDLEFACDTITKNGYKIQYSSTLFCADNQFAGTDEERAKGFQELLDNPEVKAIMCVRGGYGTVRIIDLLDWTNFITNPKWILGFSDITVLHAHLHTVLNSASIHSSMPISFNTNTKAALESLFSCIEGDLPKYDITAHALNKAGNATGQIVGGNLSVLYSLIGSKDQINPKGKILFLEDLDEYLYHIDRMLQNMKRAGLFDDLAGLIIGGMTDMNDNTIPFGEEAEAIIHRIASKHNYPVLFGFPAGHINDNQAIVMGKSISLEVNKKGKVRYI
jgi:muramoyltetrapeptide carboxypeptidase